MFSIWEKQSFLKADICILGAGITGLSTAATLKEHNKDLRVVVLERGVLPSGASTKNAGFACFGSVSELLNDIDELGTEGMVSLVEKRINGLEKTRTRLGSEAIDLQVKGGYELLFTKSEALEAIDRINGLLSNFFKENVYRLVDHKISEFGFSNTAHMISNQYEGQLDSGKLISSLWDYCSSLGVKIYTGCKVDRYTDKGDRVEIDGQGISFQAQKLGICTNAFSKEIIVDQLDLSPGRGMVMSIRPEHPLKFEGTFHYDQGYYYFRDYYGKLIFGGARNIDLHEETTTDFGINEKIQAKLKSDVEQLILPGQAYQVENTWSGIMAFGSNKSPILKSVSQNVAIGVRLGGMGVAIGSLVGDELAHLLTG